MKITYRRVVILLILISLSVGFGFAYDGIATAIERNRHPIDARYAKDIRTYAEEFGIPEHILWATVCVESDFASNLLSSDGKIGLMQISPERFDEIVRDILKEEPMDHGMLYNPSTNLRAGAALLSELYRRYGDWKTVYAAYRAGTEQIDRWLADAEIADEYGRLGRIPDADIADYADEMSTTAELYLKLYFNAS